MHNLKEIRKNFSEFAKSLEKRSVNVDFTNLEKLDELNRELIQKKESLENEKKEISKSKEGFGPISNLVNEGVDYSVLENARKLESNEYNLHDKLGYISLSQPLNNDEILAVAFQYTIGDQVYQVGEFANDGVQAKSK